MAFDSSELRGKKKIYSDVVILPLQIISRWVFFPIFYFISPLTGNFSPIPSETAQLLPKIEILGEGGTTQTHRSGHRVENSIFWGKLWAPRGFVGWNTSASRNKWGKWRKILPLWIGGAQKTWGSPRKGFEVLSFLFFYFIFLWIPNKSSLRWVFINYRPPPPGLAFPRNGNIFLSSGSASTVRAMI